MSGRALTLMMVVLLFVLGLIVVSPERGLSKFLEKCGETISEFVG